MALYSQHASKGGGGEGSETRWLCGFWQMNDLSAWAKGPEFVCELVTLVGVEFFIVEQA